MSRARHVQGGLVGIALLLCALGAEAPPNTAGGGVERVEVIPIQDLVEPPKWMGLYGRSGFEGDVYSGTPDTSPPYLEVDYFLEILEDYFAEDGPPDEWPTFSILGNLLALKGTKEQRRMVRAFVDRLREIVQSFSPGPVEIDLDLIACEPGTALQCIRQRDGLGNGERAALLKELHEQGRGKVLAQRLRCTAGTRCEVSGRGHKLGPKGGDPNDRGVLRVVSWIAPGGLYVEVGGLLDLSSLPSKAELRERPAPKSSRLFVNTRIFVPDGRTVVAAACGAPPVAGAEASRNVLLLIVRGRAPKRKYEGELGRGRYFFDVRDILDLSPANRPLLLLQPREKAEEQIEADVYESDVSGDPDALMQVLMDATGGDEVWDEGQSRVASSVEYHGGLLLVTTPQPAVAQRVRDLLGKLRALPKGPARLTALWLSLDRKAEETLPRAEDDPSALTPEGMKYLISLLSEGKSARLLDAAGTQLLFQDNTGEVGRGDSWEDWPGAEGPAGEQFLPGGGRHKTGMACVFHAVGKESRLTADVDLLFRASSLTEVAPGGPEASSLGWASPMTVENGRWYLLPCGPLMGDGRSGTYLLLGGYWKQGSSEPRD